MSYEDRTYESLMREALGNIDSELDKREGSMVFGSIAPSMAELARLYTALSFEREQTYISTASRPYLILRAADRGISPEAATKAVFRAEFNTAVPVGTRFSCDDLNFTVTGRMNTSDDTSTRLSHKAECETAGAGANSYSGRLIPIDYINGLTRAQLCELITPGEDEEETEAFRKRVLESLQTQSFGGNIADYKEKVLSVQGVRGVKVYAVWNKDVKPSELVPDNDVSAWFASNIESTPPAVKAWLLKVYTAAKDMKLTVGGCVRVVVLPSDMDAQNSVVAAVQNALDPKSGEGLGLAPIGHVVSTVGVSEKVVNIGLSLTYKTGKSFSDVKGRIESIVDGYFDELSDSWEDSDNLVVRISQLESRILSGCSDVITDLSGTKLCGAESNVILGKDSIPKRGTVSEQTA